MAAGFLRRAKSTRDARKRGLPDHHHQLEEEGVGLFAAALISPVAPTTNTNTNSNTIWTRARMRRKSFSSNRESMLALGLSDAWNPPPTTTTTITAEERKKRTSAFFGLITPTTAPAPAPAPAPALPPPPPPPEPKRAPPPPPIRLFAFPQQPKPRPSTAAGGGYGGSDDDSVIGVALGSPTGTLGAAGGDGNPDVHIPSLASLMTPQDSPGFFMPNSPFGIEAPAHVSKTYDEPKTGGWKRIFGKGLFGRKGTGKAARGTTPDAAECRAPSPRVLTKSKHRTDTRRTPCLDVDIPNVEMERYSVMFGTLLHPSEKSTLYARRRSRDVGQFGAASSDGSLNGHQISTGHSLEVPKLQMNTLKRNATTTSHISPRSPLSMLSDDLRRISSDSRRSPSPSPGLWRRGTTAADGRPPASPRPLPPTDFLSPPAFAPPGLAPSGPPVDRTSISLPLQRPSSRSSVISRISEESTSSTPSTPSFDEGDDHKFQILSHEPAWEMLNTSACSSDSLPSSPDDELEVAAQISIARQISISKRQLLIPVVPKAQMLVSRESMKPRLVEHRRSRSSRVVLAGGEKAELGYAV